MPVIEKTAMLGDMGAALFTACTNNVLPLWEIPVALSLVQTGDIAAKTALRELEDGCIRLAYQRDDTVLVADCYSPCGRLVNRVHFPLPAAQQKRDFHAVIFASDDIVYWIGRDYGDSLRLDLSTATVTPLALPDDNPIAEDGFFEVNATLLLDNGDLVLAGGDLQADRYCRSRIARVVVIGNAGTVKSAVESLDGAVAGDEPFSALIPVHGTDRYLVQRLQRGMAFSEAQLTYLGEGVTLQYQPALDDRKILYADTRGFWFDELGMGIICQGARAGSGWILPGLSLQNVQESSDGQYLALDYEEGQYRLLKINPLGVVHWSVDVTPGVGYKSVSFCERKGRILVTQCSHHVDATWVSDDRQAPPVIVAAGNKRARVQHRLLGLDGREIARFAEPGYDAVLFRHPERPEEFCGVKACKAGSYRTLGATMLRNGSFVSLSEWCSHQPDADARLFYFSLA